MQISMFGKGICFPHSYDEILILYNENLKDSWEEEDAFTWNDLSNKGRSYYFYGQKIFEFYPGEGLKARLKLIGKDLRALGIEKENMLDDNLYTVNEANLSSDLLEALIGILSSRKKEIFRNTITEEFGCCNDFMKCSDAKECLYPQDRFFNGCQYRRNLEAGKIFYGKNRNIKGEASL